MIYVATVHNPIPGAVDHLKLRLGEVFDTAVASHEPTLDPVVAFDSRRHQYNSSILLAELLKETPSPADKLIAVVDFDLFIPVLTFVFGEAQLNGRVAIASSYRLRNSFYGLPDDEALLLERLEKEAVHELGHAHNLIHCANYNCVMHASTSVEEVDVKGANFCRACRQKLKDHYPNTV